MRRRIDNSCAEGGCANLFLLFGKSAMLDLFRWEQGVTYDEAVRAPRVDFDDYAAIDMDAVDTYEGAVRAPRIDLDDYAPFVDLDTYVPPDASTAILEDAVNQLKAQVAKLEKRKKKRAKGKENPK